MLAASYGLRLPAGLLAPQRALQVGARGHGVEDGAVLLHVLVQPGQALVAVSLFMQQHEHRRNV